MSLISTVMSSNTIYHNKTFGEEMMNVDGRIDNIDENGLLSMDGKRMRKAVFRRTIDYNSSVTLLLEQRLHRYHYSNRTALQPDVHYQHLLTPPQDYRDNPMNCVCAKHVRTSTNKNKCPIYSLCWTPDGRRLITGASSGEFTLWNGLTFNFETILQAHDTHIKAMRWSHNEEWLLSGDDLGMVKYWQANMNDVNVFQAHKDAVRGLSFCPSDKKFVTCSVDNTVRIWDFQMYKEERVLRGHGGEVKCVAWHPTKSLVLSGSKDSQQPMKLWDPKAGECISTMYVHKSTCNDIGINKNGNWFLTASKDHTIKLFDLRNLKCEMQVFRGHKKDVIRVAWHPFHENLFASGSGDGALMYWMAGTDMEVGSVEDAHDNIIWSLDWHPMGHILASGSNDFATKFWTRNRPGDVLKDNLQVDHNTILNKTSELNRNIDTELDNIVHRVKKESPFDEFDLQRLSSSIEADLEKNDRLISDIPGLSEGMMHDLETEIADEDLEDKEARLKGAASRIIPKLFASNWASKKSTPIIQTIENHPPFVPPQSASVSQAPPVSLMPPSVQNSTVNRQSPMEMQFQQKFPDEPPIIRPLMQGNFRPHIREQFFNFPAQQQQQQRFRSPGFIDRPPEGYQIDNNNKAEQNEPQYNRNCDNFPPSFGHQNFQSNRPPMRSFQNFPPVRNFEPRDEDFRTREEFVPHRAPFMPDRRPNYQSNHQQIQRPPRNFSQKSTENPFEPQKSTGSSKTFIPLSFNNDGPPPNKRYKPRHNNKPNSDW